MGQLHNGLVEIDAEHGGVGGNVDYVSEVHAGPAADVDHLLWIDVTRATARTVGPSTGSARRDAWAIASLVPAR